MVEKHFNKGDVIFCEGDSGDSFFHIIKGKVDVIVNYGKDDETKLTELGAGKIFGEMAALDYYRRSATIVAAEDDTVVKEVSQKDIDVYFDEQPEKILEIMRSISSRIRELKGTIVFHPEYRSFDAASKLFVSLNDASAILTSAYESPYPKG